jgi:uncharacterized protein DUF6262
MRPNNTAPLITAARHRHELTRSKTIQTLPELDHAGTPVTFDSVAKAAGVSRSWLYTQPDIRTEIERLRELTRRTPTPSIPTGQRASDASLHTRLQAALQRNHQLAQENQHLRRQLATTLGEQRASPRRNTNNPTPQPTTRHTSTTIEPC